jgi:hypothetical protein
MHAAHRQPSTRRHAVRRSLAAAALAVATIAGFLAVAPGTASAAGPWFVAPGGGTTAACPGTNVSPCATVSLVIAKAAFVSGDTINVAAGTYADRPLFQTKTAVVQGAGTATTIFSGSNVSFAMGTLLGAGVPLSLNNLTLTNGNTATGGALAIGGGVITTNNVNLTNSKSPLGAGAYVAQGTTLNMNGGTVSGNTATASATALTGGGGGIYVVGKVGTTTAAGKLNLSHVTVTGNVANGGAAIAGGNGGGILNAGTATITGSTFSANQAVASSNANARRGQGGAIFNGPQDTDDAPTLTISDTTITGGLAAGAFNASSGGALANDEGFGGPAATLSATNVTMTANSALVGGGLYNGGTATITGGTLQGNGAVMGGGAYQSPLVTPAALPTATFDGTTFTSNLASGLNFANFGNGGAIFNTEALTVKNATFTGNQAVAATVASTVTGWGGAIYSGPFAANDAPTLNISDTTINGGGVSGGNAVIGGGISNTGNVLGFAGATASKLDATRLTLSKNIAAAAGGAYTGGVTNLTDSTFDQNQATHASAGFGGGLYAARLPATGTAPVVTIDHTAFTTNTAGVVGGGIALLNGVTLTLRNGSTVTGNTAVSGAGIINAGTATVRDSAVSNNNAAFQGGGIFNGSSTATDTPTLTLTNATIDGNTAANVGGGVVTIAGASLTATGGEVNGNNAAGGGGIYVGDNAPASFDSTDVIGNTATASAGGGVLNSGTLSISRALLQGNHAIHTTGNIGLGGAIYSGSNNDNVVTKLTVDASTISGNDAWAGAALITYSPGTGVTNQTSIDRSTITGNTNGTSVGSIEQFHPLTITNSTITDNTTNGTGSAGLSMIDPAHVGVAGTILSGNSGGSCSSAPVDGGYNLTDPGDTSCGFTAASHDVAAAPQLGALGSHGGDTPTRVPGPASPALDVVPVATATGLTNALTGSTVQLCAASSTDQRGVARPQGAKCDIGSVEADQTVPTVAGPASADYSVGSPGAPVTFTSTGSPQPTLSETGSLPAGVTFHDNGDGTATLSGTPAAGTGADYPITVKATNEAGTGTADFTLVVHQAPLLGGPASDSYTVGVAGGPDQFHMTSGHPDAVLSTSSTLPDGVTFTPGPGGTATIQGTPAVGSGGVYTIVINGTNGTPPDATLTFTLTVREAPTIAGPATGTFTVGTAHSTADFTTTGTPTPTLSATGLPAGLSLTSTGPGTAHITGTAANHAGGEYDVTVTATNGVTPDASTVIHLVVREAPELTGPTAARFVTGSAGTVGFSADGYPQAALTATGALPPGLTFVDNGNGTATLSGTAATGSDGTYPITVTASNGVDPDAVIHLSLEVVPPVLITTTSLPNAAVGTHYSAPVVAIGGQPTYAFTLVGGSLPAGLTLAADGTISGTPTGPTGTSTFTVKVTDGSLPAQTATKELSITVGKGATTLTVEPVVLKLVLTVNLGTAKATLTGGDPAVPIAGQTIVFKAGATTVCTGVTGADGKVSCTMTLANTLLAVLNLGVTASYGGNAIWLPSSGSAGLLAL